MKKTKQKNGTVVRLFKKSPSLGAKVRDMNKIKKKTGADLDEPVVDKFIDEDTHIDVEDAVVNEPNSWDIRDEVSHLESFRDYQQESRGNGLTYGDY